MLAGIAGALYVPQVGIINPSEFAPINSIEVVIWVAVGGRGTLYGAAAGAVLVNYAKTYFTGALPEVWLYALGALFVLVTLFLPRGLIGLLPPAASGEMSGRARVERRAAPSARSAWRDMREAAARAGAAAAARQDPLSREPDRQLRRLQGAQRLTLYVDPGELRCIIGPNGAGKTTMMDVITGKTRPDHGLGVVRPEHRPADADRAARSRRPASAASSRSRRVFE